MTPALADEIRRTIARPDAADGYAIARKNLFQGVWIRHAGMYPDWQLRLFRRGRARYEDRIVHEHMMVEGRTDQLREPMIHHDYKGIERYFERHNSYTSLEAVEAFRLMHGLAGADHAHLAHLNATGDAAPARRRRLKSFAYRYVPCRSLAVFLYMYVWRLGFLDGRRGFRYCLIRAFHEYQLSLKLDELRDPQSPMRRKYARWITRDD
ncbi:MAG: glycosyltransferase family 2 protein [Alphaproteobacteria bacterium]